MAGCIAIALDVNSAINALYLGAGAAVLLDKAKQNPWRDSPSARVTEKAPARGLIELGPFTEGTVQHSHGAPFDAKASTLRS